MVTLRTQYRAYLFYDDMYCVNTSLLYIPVSNKIFKGAVANLILNGNKLDYWIENLYATKVLVCSNRVFGHCTEEIKFTI